MIDVLVFRPSAHHYVVLAVFAISLLHLCSSVQLQLFSLSVRACPCTVGYVFVLVRAVKALCRVESQRSLLTRAGMSFRVAIFGLVWIHACFAITKADFDTTATRLGQSYCPVWNYAFSPKVVPDSVCV